MAALYFCAIILYMLLVPLSIVNEDVQKDFANCCPLTPKHTTAAKDGRLKAHLQFSDATINKPSVNMQFRDKVVIKDFPWNFLMCRDSVKGHGEASQKSAGGKYVQKATNSMAKIMNSCLFWKVWM
ncbi:unnamed protein product [Ilex paraguariensis]|uniref:Uncharacterized protein n=1 Tax=Ilex paraguariensis TaxID=185542 RepID=A0ABC8U4A3_9AQUA